MRGKGINYDTGVRLSGRWTRNTFDSATARRELEVIAGELVTVSIGSLAVPDLGSLLYPLAGTGTAGQP